MSDDIPTGRDLRTIWRTIAVVAICGVAVAGTVLAAIIREVRQDNRIEALEEWRAEVKAERAREARREQWLRDRERVPFTPRATP